MPADSPRNDDERDVTVPTPIAGIVLAAGAGSRMGTPKALMRTADGTPWLQRTADLLAHTGCAPVLVVLGAAADEAQALLAPPPTSKVVASDIAISNTVTSSTARTIIAPDWSEGMSRSLHAGLAAAVDSTSIAVVVTLVDMPALPESVVRRILESPVSAASLRQAVYDGEPGHPVLIGRDHWPALTATLTGDRGARAYLVANGVEEVECSELYDGHDIDTAEQARSEAHSQRG